MLHVTRPSPRHRAPAARGCGATTRTHRIDFAQAQAVAHAFLAAPRSTSDATVRAAYAALGNQAEHWFAQLTSHRARMPIRVVRTRCPEPYPTAEELAERVRAERVLELRPAQDDRDRSHPLLDTSPLGTYDRLRAVHDIVSHARLGFGFDRHGEFSAWLAEDRMYRGLARWALATELHAEHSVLWTTGVVAEHKATLLPLDVLEASRCRARLEASVPAAGSGGAASSPMEDTCTI